MPVQGGKYFWCYDHARARRFTSEEDLAKHNEEQHADQAMRSEADDPTVERKLLCRKGCSALFRTEAMRSEHERRFHEKLWADA